MFGLLDAAARKALRHFGQRALQDRRYLVLAGAALLAHLALRPEKPNVAREELRLGETLLVRHLPPPPTRRAHRRAARAARKADAAAARLVMPPAPALPPLDDGGSR